MAGLYRFGLVSIGSGLDSGLPQKQMPHALGREAGASEIHIAPPHRV